MGKVGFVQRLQGKVAPLVCHQRGAHLLRAHPANVAEARLTEELLAESNLGKDLARKLFGDLPYPSEALGARLGRVRDLSGDREARLARPEAAHRDRPFEPQASVRAGWDAGDDAGGPREQDRGEDLRLHLRLSGQSPPGSCPGTDQRAVGVNLPTHI